MTTEYTQLLARAREWYATCQARGALDETEIQRLEQVEQRTPGDLFADQTGRPLVVAFFGGTGVGKSSLLNRLVGAEIAKTGVERPTSQELTLYVHESIKLAELPAEIPIEQFRVSRHHDDSRRNVVWIDTPDIDSTRESNRQLVLSCLPHIDLLIYVVTPERYRDDAGWRVLLQRGGKHGWLFVMNHWDQGAAVQRDDFAAMLRAAGVEEPRLFCTSCKPRQSGDAAPTARAGPTAHEASGELFGLSATGASATLATAATNSVSRDEFEHIEGVIQQIVDAHGVRELERLGHRARLLELRRAIEVSANRLGDDEQWTRSAAEWAQVWSQTRVSLAAGMEWAMRSAGSRLAARERGGLAGEAGGFSRLVQAGASAMRGLPATNRADDGSTARSSRPGEPGGTDRGSHELSYLTQSLWDEWAEGKTLAALDQLELSLRRRGIYAGPIRRTLDERVAGAGTAVQSAAQEAIREAMADPGHAVRRVARRITGFLMGVMPAIALSWVTFRVVSAYYEAGTDGSQYLNMNFVVHSLLMVLLAWALPFTIDRILRPSLENQVVRRMRSAVEAALIAAGVRFGEVVTSAASDRRELRQTATAIQSEIDMLAAARPGSDRAAVLSQILIREQTTLQSV